MIRVQGMIRGTMRTFSIVLGAPRLSDRPIMESEFSILHLKPRSIVVGLESARIERVAIDVERLVDPARAGCIAMQDTYMRAVGSALPELQIVDTHVDTDDAPLVDWSFHEPISGKGRLLLCWPKIGPYEPTSLVHRVGRRF